MMSTRCFLILPLLLASAGTLAASLPSIHNGSTSPPKPPSKVLGCRLPAPSLSGLNPSPGAFTNCVRDVAIAYADEVAEEQSEPLNETIEQLRGSLSAVIPDQVQQCLGNLGTSTSAAMASAQNNPAQFVFNRLNALSQVVHDNAQAMLSVDLGAPETNPARAQRFVSTLVSAAAADPVTACLFQLSAQTRNQIISAAYAQADQLQARMAALYQTHLESRVHQQLNAALTPALQTLKRGTQQSGKTLRKGARVAGGVAATGANATAMAAGAAVAGAASLVPVPEHIQLMAKGLRAEMMLNPKRLNGLAQDLSDYAQGDVARAERLQRGLNAAAALPEQTAVNLGIRVLRHYGHEVIDFAGTKALDAGFAYLDGWKAVVLEVVDIPCATAVWTSEAVCSVGEGVVSIILTFAAVEMQNQILAEIHSGFDQLVTAHHQAIKNNGAPIAASQQHPVFGRLLQHFPNEQELLALMMPDVASMSDGIGAYHRAVAQVVGDRAGPPATGRPVPSRIKLPR